MTPPATVPVPELPDTVRSFLTAHASRDVEAGLSFFAPDAEVTDEAGTFRGSDEVRTFLSSAGTQFRYTTTLVGAERLDDDVWVARNRLEGDFPGGVADLAYRFELSGGLIRRLDIAP